MKKQLTREEFDILAGVYEKRKAPGENSPICRELKIAGYFNEKGLTPSGAEALEPYRAKRAILIAAGMGERMLPITINTPKPLVRVNGVRMIDTSIDACLAAGIHEIYIVRGYLGEQFDQLLKKYPMIHFLENPVYERENNISSVIQARTLLQNAYIFEADLYISQPRIVRTYHYASNYLGIKKQQTDDWCFMVQNGTIQSWKHGGTDCYQEIGISYWDAESGKRLEKDIKDVYEGKDGKQMFWDYVPLCVHHREYLVEIRECSERDVIEIDTFEELKLLDSRYNV